MEPPGRVLEALKLVVGRNRKARLLSELYALGPLEFVFRDLLPAPNDHLAPGRPLEYVPQAAVNVWNIFRDPELLQEPQVPVSFLVLDDGVNDHGVGALDGGHQAVESHPGEDILVASWSNAGRGGKSPRGFPRGAAGGPPAKSRLYS